MSICGVTIAANQATFVWVEEGGVGFQGGAKVSLTDGYSRDDLLQTMELIRQYLVERKTSAIIVRKASASGRFSAGPAAFKLEAIIALASPLPVEFTSPQTVAAFVKRVGVEVPVGLHKYQVDAYQTALSALV